MLSIDPADEDSDEEGKNKVSSSGAAGQRTPAETYAPLKVNPSSLPTSGQPVVVLNKIDATLNGAAAVPVDLIPKLNSLPNAHHNNTPNDVTVLDGEESNDASKVSEHLPLV